MDSVPAVAKQEGFYNAIIDTAKGSRNKVKYDSALRCFRLSRILPAGLAFPYNFGFIPSTAAEDGDAVDVMVLMDDSLPTGTLVTVRLLGVLVAEQTENGKTERNDRLIGVPETAVNHPHERSYTDLQPGVIADIESFFISYNKAHGRTFKVVSRRGPKAAQRLVHEGMRRYQAGNSGQR